jgi:hypothetical protein
MQKEAHGRQALLDEVDQHTSLEARLKHGELSHLFCG